MGFAAGFNSGASAVNAYHARQRQEKLDERDGEIHAERMAEIADAKKLKSDLSSASKPATFSENTPTLDTGDGARVYGMENGADVAGSDARQFQRMAPASAPPTQGQAFAVNGTAVADKPAMQAAVKSYDDGANDRIAQAYRANGKPLDALNMSNAVMENKAKSMGLESAQLKFANEKFNTGVLEEIDSDPADWTKGAAKLLTKTQVGSLAGVTVNPMVSADGKTVNFVGTDADGTSKPIATLPNTPQGRLQFTQQLMKATPEQKISWLAENGKAARDGAKDTRDERKVEILEKNSETSAKAQAANEKKIDGMIAGLIGGRRNGEGSASGVPLQEIYKRLETDFSTKDPDTLKTTKDIAAISTVRNLILQMPSAKSGDVDGAYLQAMQVYQKAQAIGKGDPAKTKQALAQILGGGSQQESYPKGTDSQIQQVRKIHGGAGPMQTAAANAATPDKSARAPWSYASQKASVDKDRNEMQVAKQAKAEAEKLAAEAQDKLVEERRRAFLLSRGANQATTNLVTTPINFSQR